MRLIRFAAIFMSVVMCQACASEQQQAKPSGTAPAASRPSAAVTKQRTDTTNMQILLDKVKADKKLLVAQNMDLTDAESAKFWPLYEEYHRELDQLNQRLAGTDHGLCGCLQEGAHPR